MDNKAKTKSSNTVLGKRAHAGRTGPRATACDRLARPVLVSGQVHTTQPPSASQETATPVATVSFSLEGTSAGLNSTQQLSQWDNGHMAPELNPFAVLTTQLLSASGETVPPVAAGAVSLEVLWAKLFPEQPPVRATFEFPFKFKELTSQYDPLPVPPENASGDVQLTTSAEPDAGCQDDPATPSDAFLNFSETGSSDERTSTSPNSTQPKANATHDSLTSPLSEANEAVIMPSGRSGELRIKGPRQVVDLDFRLDTNSSKRVLFPWFRHWSRSPAGGTQYIPFCATDSDIKIAGHLRDSVLIGLSCPDGSVPLDATALVPEPPAESPRSGSAMTGSTWSLNQESTIEKGTEASVASKDGESVVSPDIDLQALEDAVYSLADTPGGFDQDALDTLDRVLSQEREDSGKTKGSVHVSPSAESAVYSTDPERPHSCWSSRLEAAFLGYLSESPRPSKGGGGDCRWKKKPTIEILSYTPSGDPRSGYMLSSLKHTTPTTFRWDVLILFNFEETSFHPKSKCGYQQCARCPKITWHLINHEVKVPLPYFYHLKEESVAKETMQSHILISGHFHLLEEDVDQLSRSPYADPADIEDFMVIKTPILSPALLYQSGWGRPQCRSDVVHPWYPIWSSLQHLSALVAFDPLARTGGLDHGPGTVDRINFSDIFNRSAGWARLVRINPVWAQIDKDPGEFWPEYTREKEDRMGQEWSFKYMYALMLRGYALVPDSETGSTVIDYTTAKAFIVTHGLLSELHIRSGNLGGAIRAYYNQPDEDGTPISKATWRIREQRAARRTARAFGLGFSSGRSHRASSLGSEGEDGAGSDEDSNSEWEDLSSSDESD